ncbi:MAG: hypothetical protein ONA90_07600, partial [candidate division KSB1 bacterium]|nr:hypothetical protein [candidate division KSB1 bacterium]
NPSIASYQPSMLQVGMRFFHLGFIDGEAARFRLNYVSLILPRWLPAELAFAAHAQSISMPIYSQSYVSAAVSRRFHKMVAVGLKAGLLSKSYDPSEFNLDDLDDPLFRDQPRLTRVDLGGGITIWPSPFVSVALGRDHLNRPNVALGEPAFQLQPENHIAVAFHFGNLRTAFVTQNREQGLYVGGFAEVSDPELGFARLGVDELAVQLEGRIRVRGPLNLNYAFNYPTGDLRGETSGSHEFALVFEFDRLTRLPRLEKPPVFRYDFQASSPPEPSPPRAHVRADVETLEIINQRLQRTIAPDVPRHALAAIPSYDLGVLDSSLTAPKLPLYLSPIISADTSAALRGSYSTQYWHSLRQLAATMNQVPVSEAAIIASPFARPRAVSLRNYLLQNTPLGLGKIQVGEPRFASRMDSLLFYRPEGNRIIMPTEERLVLNPSAAIFHIATANFSSPPLRWQLIVEREGGTAIWKMEGRARMPNQLVWNWRDSNGELIAPGYYHYYVSWQAADGTTHTSPVRKFYVKKLQRTINIHVARKFDGLQQPADEVKMILNR